MNKYKLIFLNILFILNLVCKMVNYYIEMVKAAFNTVATLFFKRRPFSLGFNILAFFGIELKISRLFMRKLFIRK